MNIKRCTYGIKSFIVILSCLCSVNATAALQWCAGTIAVLWVTSGGDLYISPSWRGDHIRLCNVRLTTTVGAASVDQTTCLAWMSLLRQAKVSNATTIIMYDDIPSCAAIPTYTSAPIPAYVMLQ